MPMGGPRAHVKLGMPNPKGRIARHGRRACRKTHFQVPQ